MKKIVTRCVVSIGLLSVAACGGGGTARADKLTVVAYDSFTPSKEVLAAFTRQSGISVEVLTSGDTGELVNKAILTRDRPLGDVLYGVDTTFLSRAVGQGLFEPYEAIGLSAVDQRFRDLVPNHQVTPVDYGDVCINYDRSALVRAGVEAPRTLEQLATAPYKDMTVIENPATSSPGLAFLLATVAQFGENDWQDYWARLRGNGVKVVNGWEQAWNTEFSGGPGKGDRPIVVSYASSPPAAVLFGPDPDATQSPIGVAAATCFRQVEFVGLLRKARHGDAARAFIDFTIGREFQEDLPLTMFVFPVRSGAKLPDLFTRFAVIAEKPLTISPPRISAMREQWVDTWTRIVLG